MAETKFTPGPWAVHPFDGTAVVPVSDLHKTLGGSDSPDREAERNAKQICNERGTEYSTFHRSRVLPAEARANARLIASAPDLYAALEAMMPLGLRVKMTAKEEAAWDAASAALAKAKGGE